MVINLSNHSSAKWTYNQKVEANKLYGDIVDWEFPNVAPHFDSAEVHELVVCELKEIIECYGKSITIHIMGEMTFVYDFVSMAKGLGIECVASTTERIVVENADGTKTSSFNFIRFRSYGI